MDAVLVEKNRIKLVEEKKRLETLLGRFASRQKTVDREEFASKFPNLGDSEGENASEVEMYETNLGEERSLEQRLQKVNAALKRIDAGNYGKCSVGGEEIEAARLTVAPEADTCVKHSQ
mgnify:FL=1